MTPDWIPTYSSKIDGDINDPMIIDDVPHIYFSGNCEAYDSEMVEIDMN